MTYERTNYREVTDDVFGVDPSRFTTDEPYDSTLVTEPEPFKLTEFEPQSKPSELQDEPPIYKPYIDAGVAVFPTDSKAAPLTPNGFKNASASADETSKLFENLTNPNVAAVPGTGGYLVIDIDVKGSVDGEMELDIVQDNHGKLPDTLTAITPSGGRHLWYRKPSGTIIGNKKLWGMKGLDIRSDKGYVLVPPSAKANGDYAWDNIDDEFNTDEIADAPDWLIELLTETEGESKPIKVEPFKGEPSELVGSGKLYRRTLDFIENGAEESERNERLFNAACNLAGHGLNECSISSILYAPASVSGLDDKEIERTIRSACSKERTVYDIESEKQTVHFAPVEATSAAPEKLLTNSIDDTWYPVAIRSLRNELMQAENVVEGMKRMDATVCGLLCDVVRASLGKRIVDTYEPTQPNYIGAGLSVYNASSGSGKDSSLSYCRRIYSRLVQDIDQDSERYVIDGSRITIKGLLQQSLHAYNAYTKKVKANNNKYQTVRVSKGEAKDICLSNPNGLVYLANEGTEAFTHLLGAWSSGAFSEGGRVTELVESGKSVSNATGRPEDNLHLFDTCNQLCFITQPESFVHKLDPFHHENLEQGLSARLSIVFEDSELFNHRNLDTTIDAKASNSLLKQIQSILTRCGFSGYIETTFTSADPREILDAQPEAQRMSKLYPSIYKSWRKNILRRARALAALFAVIEYEPITTVAQQQTVSFLTSNEYDRFRNKSGVIDASNQIERAVRIELYKAVNSLSIALRMKSVVNPSYLKTWVLLISQSEQGYARKSDMIRAISTSSNQYYSVSAELEKAVDEGKLVCTTRKTGGRPSESYSLPSNSLITGARK